MALITRVYLVDDSTAPRTTSVPFTFNLDGTNYEIDLGAANAELRGETGQVHGCGIAGEAGGRDAPAKRGIEGSTVGPGGIRRRLSGTGPAATGSRCPTRGRISRADPGRVRRRPLTTVSSAAGGLAKPRSLESEAVPLRSRVVQCRLMPRLHTDAAIYCRDHEIPVRVLRPSHPGRAAWIVLNLPGLFLGG